MSHDLEHKVISILKTLEKEKEPAGANFISEKLLQYGVNLSERGIRYHLKMMDERGLTKSFGKKGRMITTKGIEELENALVQEKVGFVKSRIDNLAYSQNLDIKKQTGTIILNISLIKIEDFKRSLNLMEQVFKSAICTSELVKVGYPKEEIGKFEVPEGKVGFGTVCSVTVDGVLLKSGIPVEPKFAGIVQMADDKPLRFTEIITYEGSSIDPLELFIASGMTSVGTAVRDGEGKILAGFREIPATSLENAKEVIHMLDDLGISGILSIGEPSQPLLKLEVGTGRAGFAIAGGLNPIAVLRENDILTENRALSTLVEFEELELFEQFRKKHR